MHELEGRDQTATVSDLRHKAFVSLLGIWFHCLYEAL